MAQNFGTLPNLQYDLSLSESHLSISRPPQYWERRDTFIITDKE